MWKRLLIGAAAMLAATAFSITPAGAESNEWRGSMGGCSDIYASHGQSWDDGGAYGVTQEMNSCAGYVRVTVYYDYCSGCTTYSRTAVSSSQAIADAPAGSIARYSYHWVGCDSAGNNCDAFRALW